MIETIAIMGYPGAGKSWAVSNFINEYRKEHGLTPMRHRVGLVDYEDLGAVAVMGIYDGSKFQGTDRLSMAVSVDFERFYATLSDPAGNTRLIVAEGDRINNLTFLQTAMKYGTLLRIKCDPDNYQTLLKQRAQREHTFSQSFLKTVTSKVNKHNFDFTMNSDALLKYLHQKTDPGGIYAMGPGH